MSHNRGSEYGVQHLTCPSATTLLNFVATLVPMERALELIRLGSIYVNDKRSQNETLGLSEGDKVRAHLSPRRYPQPSDLTARIVEETKDYLVVDKPAGLPVHPLVDNARENLISFLDELRATKHYVTHRLDVETSGLVLIALNPETQAVLNAGFANQTIKRSYIALTEREIAPNTYVHYMEQSPKAPKVVGIEPNEGWLRCELQVTSCEKVVIQGSKVITSDGHRWSFENETPPMAYELKIDLVTGRPQQIRAQISSLGAPLLGDKSYGSPYSLFESGSSAKAIALRAWKIKKPF